MYQPSVRQLEDVERRFVYHPPDPEKGQVHRYKEIRDRAHDFAEYLLSVCPESRELSIALTHLDELVMNANAAIARNE